MTLVIEDNWDLILELGIEREEEDFQYSILVDYLSYSQDCPF